MTPLRLAGWGRYRPRETRPSTALDSLFCRAPGWTEREFGIAARGIAAPDETSSMMGAEAARAILTRAASNAVH